MSARVFNPLVMSEMRRMIGRSSSDGSGTTAAVARVRRDLFGPINHEDAQSFVDKELAAIRQRESDKWGFDFVKEAPLDSSRFRWERVTPEENFPEAYATRRLLGQSEGQKKDASTNTTTSAVQETSTTQRVKSAHKQSQITDYLKQCRKRSLSVGDLSRKVSSHGSDVSSPRRITTAPSAKRSRPARQ